MQLGLWSLAMSSACVDLSVCVCECVCVYVCMYVCVYLYIYMYVYIYIMLHMHGLIFCQCDFSNSVVFFENVIFQISSFFRNSAEVLFFFFILKNLMILILDFGFDLM
jgi:hypothetical protein